MKTENTAYQHIVYHGSKEHFKEFDLLYVTEGLELGGGFYFTPAYNVAASYAQNNGYIYKVRVDIKNPYKTGVGLIHKEEFKNLDSMQIRQTLIDKGYDGAMHVWWDGTLYDQSVIVAFYPEQIEILEVIKVNKANP